MWPAVRRVAIGLALVGFAAWFVFLRPQLLGGPAAYITVAGVSMEPTLRAGDLVVMTRADRYEPGDVVAYRVPDGDPAAGRHVIHRVIGGGAQNGYLLQGDNTPAPDQWRPTEEDIVGRQLVVLPGFGSALMLLKSPAALAGLAAALAVFALPLWDAASEDRSNPPSRRAHRPLAPARVVRRNEALLLGPPSSGSAQLLVEFENTGRGWAEIGLGESVWSAIGHDGSVISRGNFTAVMPRFVEPGGRGYLLADIADPALAASGFGRVKSIIGYRDARQWSRNPVQLPMTARRALPAAR